MPALWGRPDPPRHGGNMTDVQDGLLRGLEYTAAAYLAVEGVADPDDGFGNAALLAVQHDLHFLVRRLNNLALLHGVSPEACERARKATDPLARVGEGRDGQGA